MFRKYLVVSIHVLSLYTLVKYKKRQTKTSSLHKFTFKTEFLSTIYRLTYQNLFQHH